MCWTSTVTSGACLTCGTPLSISKGEGGTLPLSFTFVGVVERGGEAEENKADEVEMGWLIGIGCGAEEEIESKGSILATLSFVLLENPRQVNNCKTNSTVAKELVIYNSPQQRSPLIFIISFE